MSETPSRDQLSAQLGELASQAATAIRRKRRKEAMADGIDRALPFMVVVPLLWLGALGMGWLEFVTRGWVLIAALALPTLFLFVQMLRAHLQQIDDRDALAILDRELKLEDRLLTAREFLSHQESTPFTEAAIQDAARVIGHARGARPVLPHRDWSPRASSWAMLATSALLIAIALWIRPFESIPQEDGQPLDDSRDQVAALDSEPKPKPEDTKALDSEEQPTPEVERNAQQPSFASDAERRDKAGELADQSKESAGKTGEGRSSDAEASSSASESRGQPSNQSQVSKAPEKLEQKPVEKKAAKPPTDVMAKPRKNDEDDSGSTAGRGSSKGSSKNPAASKWSSKDQVTHQDDQEIEDDEETEDEEEDQESRGGVQPNLRDRKPPVSRDLRIGFGNQKNPDANGRGGPSEAKKSRGTASLVLGVPIPDRVKGQPSPGKTKITQERIEPKPEDAAPIAADSRTERNRPVGYIEERQLTPWMRTLVREYFLALRDQKGRP